MIRAIRPVNSSVMERSWDYLLKTPIGQFAAILAALFVMAFIVGGGLFMRAVMMRDHEKREAKKSQEPAEN
jgi:hypothetical protein